MSGSRRKSTQKAQPKKLSLRERLSRHWEGGKWEAFVALYLRDKEASDRSPLAERYLDGLYNCLTQSLFIHKNLENALEMARLILESPAKNEPGGTSGRQAAVTRVCAQVTLDFAAMRKDGQAAPWPLLAGEELPEPWRTLRAGLMEAANGNLKKGRKKKAELSGGPLAELTRKLSNQFKALPEARNLRAYTSFLQTAEALEKETAGQAGAADFQAVRALAALLRELGGPRRDGGGLRELINLQSNENMLQIPKGAKHPAVLALWNFFCEEGGKKFGRDWEAAARVLRLKFDPGPSSLATSYKSLVGLGPDAPPSIRVLTVKRKYDGWSEPEQYVLGAAFCSVLEHDGPGILSDIGGVVLLNYLDRLTELGRKWRPVNPWAPLIGKFFELMVRTQGPGFLRALSFVPPYESLTAPTVVLMALMLPLQAKMVVSSASARLPMSLAPEEIDLLSFDLAGMDPAPDLAAAAVMKKLLEPKSLTDLLAAWVRAAVEISAVNAVIEGGRNSSLAWDRLPSDLLAFIEEILPLDEPAGIFCRLCLGRGYRSLSDDPKKLAALNDNLARLQAQRIEKNFETGSFIDEPEGDGFAANLFIMLTAWPKAPQGLLLNLFRVGQPFLFEQTDLWIRAVEAVGLVKDPESRRSLARGLADDLKNHADPARREARRCFTSLQNGKKASPKIEFMDPSFDMFMDMMDHGFGEETSLDEHKKMMKKLEKLMGRQGRF